MGTWYLQPVDVGVGTVLRLWALGYSTCVQMSSGDVKCWGSKYSSIRINGFNTQDQLKIQWMFGGCAHWVVLVGFHATAPCLSLAARLFQMKPPSTLSTNFPRAPHTRGKIRPVRTENAVHS
jgi:hypothetical protein